MDPIPCAPPPLRVLALNTNVAGAFKLTPGLAGEGVEYETGIIMDRLNRNSGGGATEPEISTGGMIGFEFISHRPVIEYSRYRFHFIGTLAETPLMTALLVRWTMESFPCRIETNG